MYMTTMGSYYDKFTQIHSVNPYDTLHHAVVDWLYTKDKEQETLKIAHVVKTIAQQVNVKFEPNNDTNLFHIKQDIALPGTKQLLIV